MHGPDVRTTRRSAAGLAVAVLEALGPALQRGEPRLCRQGTIQAGHWPGLARCRSQIRKAVRHYDGTCYLRRQPTCIPYLRMIGTISCGVS
mmetsp:Transcript_934/g.1431  ORF Transcript_934/g.1431 Transcript_934/m.1431 type:complete len:91 (-) Transcript_934:21-293(-)